MCVFQLTGSHRWVVGPGNPPISAPVPDVWLRPPPVPVGQPVQISGVDERAQCKHSYFARGLPSQLGTAVSPVEGFKWCCLSSSVGYQETSTRETSVLAGFLCWCSGSNGWGRVSQSVTWHLTFCWRQRLFEGENHMYHKENWTLITIITQITLWLKRI